MMRQPTLAQSFTVRLILLSLAVLAGLWWLGVKPAQASLRRTALTRDDQIKAALANSEKGRLLGEAQQKYTSLSSDLDRLEGVIPEASETGSFVSALEDAAARSGVKIDSLTTKIQPKVVPPAPKANAKKTPAKNEATPAVTNKTVEQELLLSFNGTLVDVRLTGNYAAIRGFVQIIRQMERFVSITSISLSTDQSATDPGVLSGTVAMTIFHRQPAKEQTK